MGLVCSGGVTEIGHSDASTRPTSEYEHFNLSIHTSSKINVTECDPKEDMDDVSMFTSNEMNMGPGPDGWVIYDVISKPYTLMDESVIVSSFPCPCDVHSICPNAKGQAWTCDMFSNDVTLVDNTGYVIQRITCRSFVDDISLADDKLQSPFLLCTRKKTVMDLRCPKSIFKTDHKPSSLCYVGQNHVIVGTKQKLTKYTTQGEVVLTSTRQDSGIIWPWRICHCVVTGNIAIVDTDLKHCGGLGKSNIVVMDTAMKPLFRYRGKGSVSMSNSSYFEPSDVAYDSHGNFVVADHNSHSLELVSGEGRHLRTLHTDTGRIQAVGIQTSVPKRPGEEGNEEEEHSADVLWAAFYYSEDEDEMDQIKLFNYYS